MISVSIARGRGRWSNFQNHVYEVGSDALKKSTLTQFLSRFSDGNIWLLDLSMSAGGRKEFLLSATPPRNFDQTFLKALSSSSPGAYCR